jgi:hypothetical protein
MDKTLESLKVAFSEWRSSKRCRSEPIPPHLWTRVCEVISDAGGQGLYRLAKNLSLDNSMLKNKYANYVAEKTIINQVEVSSQELKQSSPAEKPLDNGDENVDNKQMASSVQSVVQIVSLDSPACEASSSEHLKASIEHRPTNKIRRKLKVKRSTERRPIHVTRLMMDEDITIDHSRGFDGLNMSAVKNTDQSMNRHMTKNVNSQIRHPYIGAPIPDFIATISFMDVSMIVGSRFSHSELSAMFVSISKQVSSFRRE